MFCNIKYDPEKESTQLSLNLDSLGITSCYLVKLDSPTSHVSDHVILHVTKSVHTDNVAG